jgi:hypothetical protein
MNGKIYTFEVSYITCDLDFILRDLSSDAYLGTPITSKKEVAKRLMEQFSFDIYDLCELWDMKPSEVREWLETEPDDMKTHLELHEEIEKQIIHQHKKKVLNHPPSLSSNIQYLKPITFLEWLEQIPPSADGFWRVVVDGDSQILHGNRYELLEKYSHRYVKSVVDNGPSQFAEITLGPHGEKWELEYIVDWN